MIVLLSVLVAVLFITAFIQATKITNLRYDLSVLDSYHDTTRALVHYISSEFERHRNDNRKSHLHFDERFDSAGKATREIADVVNNNAMMFMQLADFLQLEYRQPESAEQRVGGELVSASFTPGGWQKKVAEETEQEPVRPIVRRRRKVEPAGEADLELQGDTSPNH